MTGAPPPEPLCVRINDAARMLSLGRTKLYELIAAGEVETIRIGKSTRVTTDSIRALITRLRETP